MKRQPKYYGAKATKNLDVLLPESKAQEPESEPEVKKPKRKKNADPQ